MDAFCAAVFEFPAFSDLTNSDSFAVLYSFEVVAPAPPPPRLLELSLGE